MEIQLYFKLPEKISSNLVNPDYLVISFSLGNIFIDEVDFQRLDQQLELKMPLPQ